MLLALVPAVVILFLYAGNQSSSAQQRARDDVLRVLESDQHSLKDLLREARATLVTFSESEEVQQADWKKAQTSARRIKAAQRDYLQIGVASLTGDVVVSAVATTTPVNVADRLFFRRALEYRSLSIGDCQKGKITGRASLNLAYPVLGATGEVKSVAYVALDLESFRRRLAPAGLPPSATEALLDPEGKVLLTEPRDPGQEAKLFSESEVSLALRRRTEASGTIAGADGRQREYYLESVLDEPGSGLFLGLGFSPTQVFAGQRRVLLLTLAGFALTATVATSAAWILGTTWIYRPTQRLAETATRIGRGDLSARAGLKDRSDEIGTLAREFDSMAGALESEVAELQRTRAELAGLNDELEERVRQRTDELAVANRIAGTLQQSLLSVPDAMEGVEFGHFYGSATEYSRVGGDFYDIFHLPGSLVAFLIGDVSGKGLEAASLTALVKNALRAYAVEGDPPADALRKTNEVAQRFTAMETFVTVFFAILDTRTGIVSYAVAGHPSPMVVCPQGVVALPGAGPLLGAFPAAAYDTFRTCLSPGQTVVAYTDGILEARNPAGEFYGEERFGLLLERLRSEQPSTLAEHVLAEMREFGAGRLSDDMALLAVRPVLAERKGRPRARQDRTSGSGRLAGGRDRGFGEIPRITR